MMLRRILKKYSSKAYWKDKSVLITGVNGFIGSNLSKLLISLGARVIGITDQKNKNSLLNINNQESIWSRYNIENGFIDLFGIFINYGNNFFNEQIAYSIPLMYKIIIDEKINSKNSNLVINEPFKTANENNNKLKFINLKNDSIIFFNSSNKIFFSKDLMALIVDNKIRSLYSFNPDPKNFNTPKNKLIFPYILIDYNDDNNFKTLFSNKLNNSDLSNIFIYCLFLFLIIEMLLSNAKPPKSD